MLTTAPVPASVLVESDLSGGRRLTSADVGRLGTVTVLEAPATELTEAEWDLIRLARRSYLHMWGAAGSASAPGRDVFDGRDEDARQYRTVHYIATIRTPGAVDKVLTQRRVALAPGRRGPEARLPDDLALWRVVDLRSGESNSLAEALRRHLEDELEPGLPPGRWRTRLATFGRSGTHPFDPAPKRDVHERNRTAVSNALIQVAATRDGAFTRYMGEICAEFRTTAFALHRPGNDPLELDLAPSAEELGLAPESYAIRLDRGSPVVVERMLSVPGYWLDNSGLARCLARAVREGLIRPRDLARPCAEALASPEAVRIDPGNCSALQQVATTDRPALQTVEQAVEYLSRARYAKHLVALLHVPAVAARVLDEVGDGPYSTCMEPKRYRDSALAILDAARQVYCSPRES